MPKELPLPDEQQITPREWLRLLPWDIIYALGVLLFLALAAALSFLVSKFF